MNRQVGEGGYTGALIAVTTLFFAWGFIISLGYATALIVPAASYALLCLFAISAGRAAVSTAARPVTTAVH